MNTPDKIHLPELGHLSSHGALLFELIKNLKVAFGFERSFKMQEKFFLPNRILFSVAKLGIGADHDQKIIEICRRLKIPSELLAFANESLAKANVIHFGYEENESGCIYKTYFEYEANYREQRDMASKTQRSIHLCSAIKWDINQPDRHTITQYTVYPSLSRAQRLQRMLAIYNGKNSTPLRIATKILELASTIIEDDDIFYLEAKEETNPRTSFDINIYNAELAIEQLQALIMELADYYFLDQEAFTKFFTTIKTETFGHLSSGIDRNGKDFFSVYYGVEGY